MRHVDLKHLNNRIESDHAALKQRLRLLRRAQDHGRCTGQDLITGHKGYQDAALGYLI
ncbi:DDE-type integrase/transposase/recombinase [Sulfitobacter sp. EhC04]|uniref:DDE-type integrase/transposase/recombinase n=1 Tax=Sulfitobacter sp. EhC04 TaxID=1849168 RepID=UPI003FCDF4D0